MATNYNPRIVTDGLLFYLDAASSKSYPGSGTAWNDLSGSGYTGTLTNGPTFNSANGGSIVFDGVDDAVTTTTNHAFGTGPFTISGWFKTNGSQPSASTIICVGATNLLTNWQVDFSNNNFFSFRGGSTTISSTHSRDDKWTTFSIVRESTGTNGLKFYINTVLNISATVTNDFSDISLYKLGRNRGNNTFYKGDISQVSIYNRALTAQEIQQNFNAIRGRFGI